ncbi:uncharacterized mitochondrial protein AtMg00810-like [Malania oleifera]|uniref:uncharacterized mitochondrial protein AtMg00810-like n=1 Tax=Malania oleifera TaxID=397392 RepID=UPI0025ADBA3A|nr:uncharacterized mitochondrial protein AtMg00810-like [Malania oleifera]
MPSYMVIWLRSSTVAQLEFASSTYDSTLFTHDIDTGITILLLYVDDMIITSDDTFGIHELKQFLCQQFEMKDLGSLSYFFDLEVSPTFDGFSLTQAKYASDLLTRVGLIYCKIADSLPELNIKLRPTDGELLPDATHYRQLGNSFVSHCFRVTATFVQRCDCSKVLLETTKETQTVRVSSSLSAALVSFSDGAVQSSAVGTQAGRRVFLEPQKVKWPHKPLCTNEILPCLTLPVFMLPHFIPTMPQPD